MIELLDTLSSAADDSLGAYGMAERRVGYLAALEDVMLRLLEIRRYDKEINGVISELREQKLREMGK